MLEYQRVISKLVNKMGTNCKLYGNRLCTKWEQNVKANGTYPTELPPKKVNHAGTSQTYYIYMAKKKEERSKQEFDVVRWINTPFVYTTKLAGLTLLQQDVLLRVSDHIQEYVTKYFAEARHKGKEVPRPLFTPSDLTDGLQPIRINLSDLGVTANHYDRVEAAVIEALSIQMRAPGVDEHGKKVMTWYNVFTKAKTPITDSGFTFTNRDGEVIESVKRLGYIEFGINPEVADYAFDMSKGYVNHPNVIARISRIDYTPVFYTLLKNRGLRNRGEVNPVRLTVPEIKDALKLYVPDKDGKLTENFQYPKYSQFKKSVLMRIQEDLDQMAEMDRIDYTFTFEEVRKEGKKTGDPIYLEFRLHKTRLGEARESVKHRNEAEIRLIKYLTDYCRELDANYLMSMIQTISKDLFVDFSVYVYREAVKLTEAAHPANAAAYLTKVLSSWISQHKPKPEEQDLFAGLYDDETPVDPEGLADEKPNDIAGDKQEQWQQLVALAVEKFPDGLGAVLQRANHLGTSDGYLSFEVSPSDAMLLNGELADELRSARALVEQIMGCHYPFGPFVKWSMMKQ